MVGNCARVIIVRVGIDCGWESSVFEKFQVRTNFKETQIKKR